MAGLFGCIADDITGGTDLAGSLAANGCRVLQVIADPDNIDFGEPPEQGFDAIVVSMKIRSLPVDDAVTAALAALDALRLWGADRIFFKYCSTFDSTLQGNIGPVAEALQDHMKAPIVTFCPSFPANGRTMYMGHLFVGDLLISNSSMRDHPLTPMVEPDLRIWLARQSPEKRVDAVLHYAVRGGSQNITERLDTLRAQGVDFALLDAVCDADIASLAEACSSLPLNSGGSAFGAGLAKSAGKAESEASGVFVLPQAQSVAILSGSCSAASQEQAARAEAYLPVLRLDPAAIGPAGELPEGMFQEAMGHIASKGRVFIASTAGADAVAAAQDGQDPVVVGAKIETAMGSMARALHDRGVRAFVVAGGETSGAVSTALSLDRLEVGPEIAPGVPWMRDARRGETYIACKSGNFGGPDFFGEALEMIGIERASA